MGIIMMALSFFPVYPYVIRHSPDLIMEDHNEDKQKAY